MLFYREIIEKQEADMVDNLYIHIPSGCTKDIIVSNLDTYIEKTKCTMQYEFLPID